MKKHRVADMYESDTEFCFNIKFYVDDMFFDIDSFRDCFVYVTIVFKGTDY